MDFPILMSDKVKIREQKLGSYSIAERATEHEGDIDTNCS